MKKHPRAEDNLAKTAISFLLGVVMGFTFLLLGLVFLMIALLANKIENAELAWYVWLLLGIFAIVIGSFMMHRNLKSVPPPGFNG
ncbi:MAG: hypothetical protein GPJ54_13935 [Candidatus Heimdallarchaeota archaeon]|nr:hypothetical protein [Candidatus Heimdallarchaeota archaeon]